MSTDRAAHVLASVIFYAIVLPLVLLFVGFAVLTLVQIVSGLAALGVLGGVIAVWFYVLFLKEPHPPVQKW